MLCTRMKWQMLGILIGGVALLGGASISLADPPTLVGIDPNKPINLTATVQAAYNNDTMFFNIEWDGDRGDTHDLVRYTNGAWQKEGGTRRDAQATIDDDPARRRRLEDRCSGGHPYDSAFRLKNDFHGL